MIANANTPSADRPRAPRLGTLVLGAAATLAVVLLYWIWIAEPHIRYDDFNFLTKSRTWSETRANLWEPMNDHAMPLSRLAAGLLMQLVPGPSAIPRAVEIQGVAAVILGMWLLYAFVRRELGHPFYALIAMTVWGVTTTYYECVTWYSASFFILALDMTLVGLLAAQWWRRRSRAAALAACAAACALAPAFHGTALLGGAWCALYLMWPAEPRAAWSRRFLAALTPIAGTVLFLAISLPKTAERIIHAEHYRGKTIFAAFNFTQGVENTLRTLADNQVLGAVGISHKAAAFSWPTVLAVVAVLFVLAAIWWRLAPDRRLLALGAALIVASDLLVYSGRADWSYERTVHNWTRYHLFPHLGLVLFIVGGLPKFNGKWFRLDASGRLSRGQTLVLAGLMALSLAAHWKRSQQSHFYIPEQIALLQRVERVDAQCRASGIDAATAREALGFIPLPLGYAQDNIWDFLRGSATPRPMSVDEARAILAPIR
jgi:hypothetical protein